MLLRSAAIAFFTAIGASASAACIGDSYIDTLTPVEHDQFDAAVQAIPFSQGVIWTATKAQKNLTIIGTMHIYDPRLDGIFAQISDDIAQADLILVEATPEDQAAVQQLVVTDPGKLFLTDGPTLPELLDDETWTLLSNAASERSIPSFMLAKMQPWYASMMLAMPSCAMADVIAGRRGLDHMIMDKAAEANVPLQSLEPYDTLFSLFQSEPMDEQIEALRMSLLRPDTQQQVFVAMLDSYFAQDIGGLWQISRFALEDLPSLDTDEAAALFDETQRVILDDRNHNWMPVIAQATDAHNNVVVAAGAAHLLGENGIINLLQSEGWTVARRP
ncbi:TraB/GumN family protein [Loktanella sp. S4079]|uniref:TraB/GumN family protein n=1 Tax=Loktanella sp. S4079 TaxID=579483 RepID=UPI0005F9F06D|nr:TraB/GumN family protein [Loktanella sp. S4079]KJZ19239.1 hypothetical protein TW80_10615 [Loktanella sp. S4079]